MGQKVNPIGIRLGIIRGWESNWYGGKNFSEKLIEDEKIRKYLNARITKGGIAKIIIERTIKRVIITIHTSRPGIVIGKAGSEVDKIKEEVKKLTKKDVAINIFEIKRPELDAVLVGESIANQVEARVSYKRAVKMAIASTMRMGAEGIKVMVSGRLGGAEMARSEVFKEGRTPLHTLRADIDYTIAEALTVYGKIGIKVWICKGEVFGKRDLSPNIGANVGNDKPGGGRPDRRQEGGDRRDRRPGGGSDRRNSNGGGGDRRNSGGGDRRRK
jgi:small subunit ribosomal protein S3